MFRGPRGRLAQPTELPSLNKVITYLLENLFCIYLCENKGADKLRGNNIQTVKNLIFFVVWANAHSD